MNALLKWNPYSGISPKDVDLRVNMLLLEMSQRSGGKNGGTVIELPMSREEMANSIGVARETISGKLVFLKKMGS